MRNIKNPPNMEGTAKLVRRLVAVDETVLKVKGQICSKRKGRYWILVEVSQLYWDDLLP
jgi:hypothetical protein